MFRWRLAKKYCAKTGLDRYYIMFKKALTANSDNVPSKVSDSKLFFSYSGSCSGNSQLGWDSINALSMFRVSTLMSMLHTLSFNESTESAAHAVRLVQI